MLLTVGEMPAKPGGLNITEGTLMDRHAEPLYSDDPLTYLPRKQVQEFAKNRVIYSPQEPSDRLYVVILGRVKLASAGEDNGQTIARIVRTEGIFGESSLIAPRVPTETATALEAVSLMSWTRKEIEQHIDRDPSLGLALTQYMVRQCLDLQDRIESMAIHKTPERVMLALIQLAETLGVPASDGSVRISALTHYAIAEYVGTSREIVTFQMNRLRRMGMLRYSRRFIDVYAQALAETLRQQGVSVHHSAAAAQASA
jgi:CRP-like cAMP-binding protein